MPRSPWGLALCHSPGRTSSTTWISAKWFPAPIVPSAASHSGPALAVRLSGMGDTSGSLSHTSLSICVRHAPSRPRSFSATFLPLSPCTWDAERVVLYHAIPQPMSPPMSGGWIHSSETKTAPMGNFVPGCRSGWATAWMIPGRVRAVVSSCVIERGSMYALLPIMNTGLPRVRESRSGVVLSPRGGSSFFVPT